MKVHFIQQEDWVAPGEYLTWAERHGYDVTYTRCWLYENIPATAEADLLVILGGHQSPDTTREECDYFDSAAQQRLIREYIRMGKPVVGACLGAQLIGDAVGAPYGRSPESEVGPVRARLTEAGRNDPFLRHFPDVFDAGEWHNDMPGLNDSAVILAESKGCPRQIVRYGKYVYGFQTHLEFTHEIIAEGIRRHGGRLEEQGRFVQSVSELLSYDYTEMNRLLSGFLDALTADYSRQSLRDESEERA